MPTQIESPIEFADVDWCAVRDGVAPPPMVLVPPELDAYCFGPGDSNYLIVAQTRGGSPIENALGHCLTFVFLCSPKWDSPIAVYDLRDGLAYLHGHHHEAKDSPPAAEPDYHPTGVFMPDGEPVPEPTELELRRAAIARQTERERAARGPVFRDHWPRERWPEGVPSYACEARMVPACVTDGDDEFSIERLNAEIDGDPILEWRQPGCGWRRV